VRYPFNHGHARRFEPRNLVRIIGEQPDPVLPEQRKHPRGNPEITRIDRKAQPCVGIDRIKALILERIGAQLVDQADPAPFLPQIEQDPPAALGNQSQRGVKLRPAIAFEAAQHIAGQAFAVEPHQWRLTVRTPDQKRDMILRRFGCAKGDDLAFLMISSLFTAASASAVPALR
jgi:hypothetical protein